MTDLEQRRIVVLRSEGKSYNAISRELNLPVNTVKTFCRRNRLGGSRAQAQISETTSKVDLISTNDRGNSSVEPEKAAVRKNTWKVNVCFSEQPDETAIDDVLAMLLQANYGQR